MVGGPGEPDIESVLMVGPDNLVYLPTLGGSNVEANAVNNSGEVVGSSTLNDSSFQVEAFVWSQATTMEARAPVGIFGSSFATSINDSGVVVGNMYNGDFPLARWESTRSSTKTAR